MTNSVGHQITASFRYVLISSENIPKTDKSQSLLIRLRNQNTFIKTFQETISLWTRYIRTADLSQPQFYKRKSNSKNLCNIKNVINQITALYLSNCKGGSAFAKIEKAGEVMWKEMISGRKW